MNHETRALARTTGPETPDVPEVSEAEVVSHPETIEGFVRLWEATRSRAEGELWRMAEIADTVVGNFERGAVNQFADQVGLTSGRISQLAKSWRLRASMPEHRDAVGSMANGRELNSTQFYEAARSREPQRMLRDAARNNWSGREINRRVERERAAARTALPAGKSLRPRPRSKDPESRVGGDAAPDSHIVRKTHVSGVCDECGGELREIPKLPAVLRDLGMTEGDMAWESGVDEELIVSLTRGAAVSQALCYRIMEVVQSRLADRKRERERMGL